MSHTFKLQHLVFIMILLGNLLLVNLAAASADDLCAEAIPADLEGGYRGSNDTPGTSEIFSIEIPSAGVAMVGVSVPGVTLTQPQIVSLGRQCAANGIELDVAIVEHSARHQVIAFRTAGSYYFRVAAQDQRMPLGKFAVQTSFVSAQIEEDVYDLDPSGTRGRTLALETRFLFGPDVSKTDQEEVDPNPKSKPLDHVLSLIDLHATSYAKTDQEEVDPNPKSWTKTDQEEVDPNPKGGDLGESARIVLIAGALSPSFGKTDQEEVDPNPKSAFAGRTFWGRVAVYSGHQAKTDQEEVDPNPKSYAKTDQEEVDPNPKSDGISSSERLVMIWVDASAGSSEAWVSWLADLVWPTSTEPTEAADERFRLLSSSSPTETLIAVDNLDW